MKLFNHIVKSLFRSIKNKLNSKKENSLHEKPMLMIPTTKFLLNDPTTPDLVSEVVLPNISSIVPSIAIKGLSKKTAEMYTREWRSSQVLTVISNTLKFMQPKFLSPVKKWAATNTLSVFPEAGEDLNAYYDRRSLRFFKAVDPVIKKNIYASESVDVVAHELGHALLDCIRPDFWSIQSLEIWSFHEAWSDLVAIYSLLTSDEIIKYVLKETKGDLMQASVMTRLAEEMGNAVYNLTGGKGGYKPGALRNANNNFVYIQPEKLPKDASDDNLSAECHSFGRVFLGAYYEVLVNIYNKNKTLGNDEITSLKTARDYTANLLAKASKMTPATTRFYDAIARNIMSLDASNGNTYQEELRTVFTNRKILLKRNVKALSAFNFKDNQDNNIVFEHKDGMNIRVQSKKTIKLSDYFGIKAQSNNPLYNCEIEIPNENYFEIDKSGSLVSSLGTSENVAVSNARLCVKFLHENNMVAYEELKEGDLSKQFSVIDGKLVRNFFTF